MELMRRVREDEEEWVKCQRAEEEVTIGSLPQARNHRWKPPPKGYTKCSIDGSWIKDGATSGMRWILRDYKGKLL